MSGNFLQKLATAFDNFREPGPAICLSDYRNPSHPIQEVQKAPERDTYPHLIKFAGREDDGVESYTVEDFERIRGHAYLPELEFKSAKTLRRIQKQCARSLKKGVITSEIKWLGALYAEQIRRNHVADVSVRWIDERLGHGLFAEKTIEAGEYVGKYAGVVRRLSMIYKNFNDYCFFYPTSDLYFHQHIIDGKDKGNELRYANHSDIPNCEARTAFCDGILHIIVRAVEDIHPGTQITYDYTIDFWQTRSPFPNPARPGAERT